MAPRRPTTRPTIVPDHTGPPIADLGPTILSVISITTRVSFLMSTIRKIIAAATLNSKLRPWRIIGDGCYGICRKRRSICRQREKRDCQEHSKNSYFPFHKIHLSAGRSKSVSTWVVRIPYIRTNMRDATVFRYSQSHSLLSVRYRTDLHRRFWRNFPRAIPL